MIELEFARVTLKNFGEYLVETSLPLGKLGFGLMFIKGFNEAEPDLGSNGAGKSTVWHALSWCLFGKTIDGRRGTDMRPWADDKLHCDVTTKLFVNGHGNEVRRSTRTNGLWLNDKVVNQETIEALIGMSYEVFTSAIIFGQGQPLFFDYKPAEKLKLLTDALHLDRWADHIKAASTRATSYDQAYRTATSELMTLDRLAATIAGDLEAARSRQTEWDEVQAKTDRKDADTLNVAREALDRARNVLGTYDLDYENAETELRHARVKADDAAHRRNDLRGKYAEVSARLNNDDERYRLAKDHLEDAKHDKVCATCGTKLAGPAMGKHMRNLEKELRDADEISKRTYEEAKAMGVDKNTAEDDATYWRGQVAAWGAKSDEIIDHRTRAQRVVMELDEQVKQSERRKDAKPVNPHDEHVRGLKRQRDETAALIVTASALVKLTTEKHASNKFWVNGFKQVRLYLLEDFLNELEVITQDMLPRLGLIGWEVQLRIEKEMKDGDTTKPGLQVMIKKPGLDRMVRWESWSGGEAQRLRVAGALALSETLLRRAGVYCDLAVFDEPTQHLSPEGVADLIDSLHEIAADRQVFLIDHTARESSKMARVITVEKDAQGAHLRVD